MLDDFQMRLLLVMHAMEHVDAMRTQMLSVLSQHGLSTIIKYVIAMVVCMQANESFLDQSAKEKCVRHGLGGIKELALKVLAVARRFESVFERCQKVCTSRSKNM